MKYLVLLCFGILLSCGGDDSFNCDKNAQFEYNGKTECAFARVENHSQSGDKLSSLTIFVTGTPTNFTFQINDPELKTNTEYKYPAAANIYGPGHNQTFSLSVTLTKLDLSSGIVSGNFNFETERDVNSAGVPFNSSGKFTDISF